MLFLHLLRGPALLPSVDVATAVMDFLKWNHSGPPGVEFHLAMA